MSFAETTIDLGALTADGRRQSTASDIRSVVDALSVIAEAVGHSDFYSTALKALAGLFGCSHYVAMRYTQFGSPRFLHHNWLTEEEIRHYNEELYRLDPAFGLVRSGKTRPVFSFIQIANENPVSVFFKNLEHMIRVKDELVFLLPAAGGIWAALCVDRVNAAFDESDISFAEMIHPLVDRLHRLHIDRSLLGPRSGYGSDADLAVLVADQDGRVVLSNPAWSKFFEDAAPLDLAEIAGGRDSGVHFLPADEVLYWEPLDATHAVAPHGRIYIIEHHSPGAVGLNLESLIASVQMKYRLTPRECEVVRLVLQGRSVVDISDRLAVSIGTVRNHKQRLYRKLGVSSERELFPLLVGPLFGEP